jgi:hypothetical protein
MTTLQSKPHTFSAGELVENMEWEIHIPYIQDRWIKDTPCPHLVTEPALEPRYSPQGGWRVVTLPKGAIVCYNEGGFCQTALCIECLDAARKSIHGEKT